MNIVRGLLLGILLVFFPLVPAFADAPPVSLNVTVSGRVRDTIVTFQGYAAPNAFITVTRDGSVIGTCSANGIGYFNKSVLAQPAGSHTYAVQAEDVNGLTAPAYSFVLSITLQTETVVSNIMLPTTIEATEGTRIKLEGGTVPNGQVTIFIHSDPVTEQFNAGYTGYWSHYITSYLANSAHTAYARVLHPFGYQSGNSDTVNFDVTCKIADLNCDGRVDLIDFSILMYYWGSTNPSADINGDNQVDLIDFSIIMYYWEG